MSTLDQRTAQGAARIPGDGPAGVPILMPVPHYAQTLDFTCGPAALMMVMKALDPTVEMSRALEMQLWREATTIFMGSGHGGSGALGLAVAAHRRGFDAEVALSHQGVLLADRARSEVKREVMRLVQETDLREARERGIPVAYGRLGADDLERKVREGWLPIVLVSTFHIHGDHVPHWIVVTGFDAEAVSLNDPWVDAVGGKTAADMSNLRVPRKNFDAMARYGKARERAVVLVRRRP